MGSPDGWHDVRLLIDAGDIAPDGQEWPHSLAEIVQLAWPSSLDAGGGCAGGGGENLGAAVATAVFEWSHRDPGARTMAVWLCNLRQLEFVIECLHPCV